MARICNWTLVPCTEIQNRREVGLDAEEEVLVAFLRAALSFDIEKIHW